MPGRVSDYPNEFININILNNIGSTTNIIIWLLLYIMYIQFFEKKAISRYFLLISQPFKNSLQLLLNKNYDRIELTLISPPKPHAFVSLPLQSVTEIEEILNFLDNTYKISFGLINHDMDLDYRASKFFLDGFPWDPDVKRYDFFRNFFVNNIMPHLKFHPNNYKAGYHLWCPGDYKIYEYFADTKVAAEFQHKESKSKLIEMAKNKVSKEELWNEAYIAFGKADYESITGIPKITEDQKREFGDIHTPITNSIYGPHKLCPDSAIEGMFRVEGGKMIWDEDKKRYISLTKETSAEIKKKWKENNTIEEQTKRMEGFKKKEEEYRKTAEYNTKRIRDYWDKDAIDRRKRRIKEEKVKGAKIIPGIEYNWVARCKMFGPPKPEWKGD